MLLPGTTGLGVPEFVTARSAPAQRAPDCVPGDDVIDVPDEKMPGCPAVAPYASSASVDHPGIPPLTLALAGADDVTMTPPPPPPPGPWRLPGKGVPAVCSGHVTPPFPPTALALRPANVPLFAVAIIVPPAPPPPPP